MAIQCSSMRSDYYVYCLIRETGLPFYIGKGKGDRWACHERNAQQSTGSYKTAIIRGMQARGIQLIRVKLHEGLTEAVAHEYEMVLIAAIGRYPAGPLVNLTVGGDGVTGLKHTPETRAAISAAGRGRQKSPQECANIATGKRGRKATPETLAILSASHLGKKATPEARARMSASHTGKTKTPEHLANLSAALRGRKFTPEWLANMATAQTGKKRSPEAVSKVSEALRGKPWSTARRAAQERRRAEALLLAA